METWRRNLYNSGAVICHYGVSKRDGAKFGSGRYPLGSGKHPKASKQAGQVEYDPQITEYRKINKKEKFKTAKSQIIGGSVLTGLSVGAGVAAFLSGYLALPLVSSALIGLATASKGVSTIVKEYVAEHKSKKVKDMINNNPNLDEETGFKLKQKETSPKEDMDMVNPGYDYGDKYSTCNCSYCVTAFEMRRRGYDVTANELVGSENNRTSDSIASDYIGAEFKTQRDTIRLLSEESKSTNIARKRKVKIGNQKYDLYVNNKAIDVANKYIDGIKEDGDSRGILFLNWYGSGGGHVVNYEVKNGKMTVYDAQSRVTYSDSEIKMLYAAATILDSPYAGYMRTDNCELNVENIKNNKIVKYDGMDGGITC